VKKQKQTKKDISLKPDTTAEERGILSRYIIYKKNGPKTPCLSTSERESKESCSPHHQRFAKQKPKNAFKVLVEDQREFWRGKELKRGNTKATAHSLKLNHTKCRAAKRNIDKQRQRERERAHTHSPQTNFFSFLNFSTATSQATKNLPFHFASEIKH
jgi:hypothetical protein